MDLVGEIGGVLNGYDNPFCDQPPEINQYRYSPPINNSNEYITDICIILKGDETPFGYNKMRLSQLNTSISLPKIEICIRKGKDKPITGICIVFPDRREIIPNGYTAIRSTPYGYSADLYQGSSCNERVFLCYRRDIGCPIRDIDLIETKADIPPSIFFI